MQLGIENRRDLPRQPGLDIDAIRLDSAVIVQWLVSISIEVQKQLQRRLDEGVCQA